MDIVLMIAGQSNGIQMSTVPVAGCNPVAGAFVWANGWRAMTAADGAGMITIANDLRQSGYGSVYVYSCCYGGSSVVPDAAVPVANCWKVGEGPLTDCLAQVAAGGKTPQFVIWVQGEQEVDWGRTHPAFDMVSAYQLYLGQLRLYMLAQWGVSAAQCPWMVTPVGLFGSGDPLPVRLSQAQYCDANAGAFLGPPRDDLALLYEGGALVHLTGPSCRTFGGRIAAALLSYIPEVEVMTDPQDKAAIASMAVGIGSLLEVCMALQRDIAAVRQSIGSIEGRLATLEPGYTLEQLDPYGDLATLTFSLDNGPS
jgi:hypothetical protein